LGVGLLLVVLGVLLYLQTQGITSLGKWWALLIMIPAVAAFVHAWNEYRDAGRKVTSRAGTAMLGGFILTAITAAILFNLDWGLVGPALLILLGIGVFFRGPKVS
jgi:hypothetical protein